MSLEKTGFVTGRGMSKNGKPTITIGGALYYAGGTDLGSLKEGDEIAFTCTSFAEGKLWGIDKGWKLLKGTPAHTPPQTQIAAPSAPTGLLSVTDLERPCCSNWGAELIKAGVVKEPADLGIWVQAILHALRGN